MRAGDLNRRAMLQERDTTLDAMGGQSTTWTDVAPLWVSIEALSARELFAAQAVQSEVSHTITARYRAEFVSPKATAARRITYAGRIYNIQGSMNIDEQNRTIELLVSEGLNNG